MTLLPYAWMMSNTPSFKFMNWSAGKAALISFSLLIVKRAYPVKIFISATVVNMHEELENQLSLKNEESL